MYKEYKIYFEDKYYESWILFIVENLKKNR